MLSQSKNMSFFVELKRESCGQKVSEQIAWRRSRRKLNHQGKAIFQGKENGGSIEGSCQATEMKTECRFWDLAKNRPLKILA